MTLPPPSPGHLTVGTVAAAAEAIRLLKRIRKERSGTVRCALLSAVEQLVASMGKIEQTVGSGRWPSLPPGAD